MKKAVIVAAALLCLAGTAAAQRHVEYKWRGFYGVVDLSYGFNLNRGVGLNGAADTASVFGLSFSSGYQFSKYTGVGLGFTYISDPKGGYTQLPIYAELRSHFMHGNLMPYGAMQVGYTLPVGASSEPPGIEIVEGGLYFGLEGGVRYALSHNFAVGGHVGYKMLQANKARRTDATNSPYLEDPMVLHMLFVGVNFYF